MFSASYLDTVTMQKPGQAADFLNETAFIAGEFRKSPSRINRHSRESGDPWRIFLKRNLMEIMFPGFPLSRE
jgi:hypothetical protein